mmetsp:Transcript_8110/g.20810  ORF Transcript_8110/g.20810 Transcript_8110/m.20810 type:complete len:203 (+) Transcript_8110:704-1312(+)
MPNLTTHRDACKDSVCEPLEFHVRLREAGVRGQKLPKGKQRVAWVAAHVNVPAASCHGVCGFVRLEDARLPSLLSVQILPTVECKDVPRHLLCDLAEVHVAPAAQRLHDRLHPSGPAFGEGDDRHVRLAQRELRMAPARKRLVRVHQRVAHAHELQRELGPARALLRQRRARSRERAPRDEQAAEPDERRRGERERGYSGLI